MIYVLKALYSFFLPPGIFIVVLAPLAFKLRRRNRPAAILLSVVTLAMYIVSTGYFGSLAIRSLEDKYSLPGAINPDVIVVLGGGATLDTPDLNGEGNLSSFAANRLLTAVRLYNIHKVPIIFSGGQVFADSGNEAQVARRMLLGLGVPDQDIIAEDKSLNTTENARNVKNILAARGFQNPVLVTSAFHMERSVVNFNKIGVKVTPVPADYQVSRHSSLYVNNFVPSGGGLFNTSLAVKEYLGLAALKGAILLNL